VANLPTGRQWCGLVVFQGKLFAVGGHGTANVECFDGERWATAPSLLTARKGPGVAVFHGKIYVAGGRASTTECFDGLKWETVKCTNATPADHDLSAAVL
jgi:hypothetical protein